MTRATVHPFRTPGRDAIPSVAWSRLRDGVLWPLEADDWDPATDLHIRATMSLDPATFREACGLDGEDELVAIVGWSDSATRIKGAAPPRSVRAERTVTCDVVVPGSEVAGRLKLRAAIVLRASHAKLSFIAAEIGTVLWSEYEDVNLAGTATRFPVEVVDFAEIPGRNPNAPWFLDWDPHESAMPILGGLRLQVNARSSRVVEAVKSNSGVPEAGAIREVVAYDVARAIVHGALNYWDAADLQIVEPSTMGALVKRLLDTLFPGRQFEALQRQFMTHAGEIDVQIAGALRTLSGPARGSM